MDFDTSWVCGENMNYIWDVITEQIKTSYYHIVWYQDIFKYSWKILNKKMKKMRFPLYQTFKPKIV